MRKWMRSKLFWSGYFFSENIDPGGARCRPVHRDPRHWGRMEDAAAKFKEMAIKNKFSLRAAEDLDKYYRLLNFSIMKYHKEKMKCRGLPWSGLASSPTWRRPRGARSSSRRSARRFSVPSSTSSTLGSWSWGRTSTSWSLPGLFCNSSLDSIG